MLAQPVDGFAEAAPSLPGLELPGKVTSIRAFGEKKRGDITYTVFIEPDRYESQLKWSMTAIIKIEPAH